MLKREPSSRFSDSFFTTVQNTPEKPRRPKGPAPSPPQKLPLKMNGDHKPKYTDENPPPPPPRDKTVVEPSPEIQPPIEPKLEEISRKLGALCLKGDMNYDAIEELVTGLSNEDRTMVISHAVDQQKTPLMYASTQITPRMCELFLANGAAESIDYQFKSTMGSLLNFPGYSALHFACEEKHCVKIVELLCLAGANVNLTENRGRTPMHFLAEALATMTREKMHIKRIQPVEEMARILNDCGAILDVEDAEEKTPRSLFPDLDVVFHQRSTCYDALQARFRDETDTKEEEDLEQLREQNAELMEQIETQKTQIETLEQTNGELEMRLNSSQNGSEENADDNFREMFEKMKAEKEELQQRLEQMETEKQQLVDERSRMHIESDDLHTQIAELKQQIEELDKPLSMSDISSDMASVNKQAKKKNVKTVDDAAVEALRERREEIERLNQEKTCLEEALREAQARLVQQTEVTNRLKEGSSLLKQELEQVEQRNKLLDDNHREALDALESTLNEKIKALETELVTNQMKLEEKENLLSEQQDKIEDFEGTVANLQEQLEIAKNDPSSDPDEVSLFGPIGSVSRKSELEILQDEVVEKDETIRELETELKAIKEEMDAIQSAHEDEVQKLEQQLSEERDALESQLVKARESLANASPVIEAPSNEQLIETSISVLETVADRTFGRPDTLEEVHEIAQSLRNNHQYLQAEALRQTKDNEDLEAKLLSAQQKASTVERLKMSLSSYQEKVKTLERELESVSVKESEAYDGQSELFRKFDGVEYDESRDLDLTVVPGDVDEIDERFDIQLLELEDGNAPSRAILLRGPRRLPFGDRDREFFLELAKPGEHVKFLMSNYRQVRYVRDGENGSVYLAVEYFNQAQAMELYQVAQIEFKFCRFCAVFARGGGGRPREPERAVSAMDIRVEERRRRKQLKCEVCNQTMEPDNVFTVNTCNHSYCNSCAQRKVTQDVERNRMPLCAICEKNQTQTKIDPSRAAPFLNRNQQQVLQQLLKQKRRR